MKRLSLLFSIVVILVVLPGCFEKKKSGDYSSFAEKEGEVAGQDSIEIKSLNIYGVYPETVSTIGMERVTIYGAGFERETKVFLGNPDFEIEAFVSNPGTLNAWMPSRYEGLFKIGVINPDGEIAYWSKLIRYMNKN